VTFCRISQQVMSLILMKIFGRWGVGQGPSIGFWCRSGSGSGSRVPESESGFRNFRVISLSVEDISSFVKSDRTYGGKLLGAK